MTVLDTRAHVAARPQEPGPARHPRTRTYGMCPPEHFDVTYAINPWMRPGVDVDLDRAMTQWQVLRETYRSLGHRVEELPAQPGQPDMVFAANGALVVRDRAYGARFRHPERHAEAAAHATWLETLGLDVVEPQHVNEGEGDFLTLGSMILGGTGFRTTLDAHVEAAQLLDRPVVSLELVDPRFYHLDVALGVLDDGNGEAPADIAYLPQAFSRHSQRTLAELFPDALRCTMDDALAFGLNLVSDGQRVVLPTAARDLTAALEGRGYTPVPVDLSELLKGGGSIKCCTMEMHA
ncbi:dimethylargininase [Aeromicrobium sp. CTD01-1L150]|uniref:dimethylargininase n=1 Tax=Aeromicrobium sp. CTD01-1L150 TaxID=3341830 RepID=UPI0035BFCEE3